MDYPRYRSQYLEGLSTEELIGLAQRNGLEIPPELERVFIIEEILYLDHDGMGKTENAIANTMFPGRQNVSMIEVLVRDPLWAFVFWEVKGHDQEIYENAAEFEGYCLRVIPLDENGSRPNMAASFTVAVGTKDNAWYLGFPPDSECPFKVELCVPQWENLIVLASSRPFRMPRLIEPHNGGGEAQAVYKNPMAQLSGVERFPLLHRMDRPLRVRVE